MSLKVALKIWTPEKFPVIILTSEKCGFTEEDVDSIANSVDPDQTLPFLMQQSDLHVHCLRRYFLLKT